MSGAFGENGRDNVLYLKENKITMESKGVHKVALRNSPGSRCLPFPAQLPYIIKAGICICLHSVAS